LWRALSTSQTQTRKQKILQDVKRKRRQRAIATGIIAAILIAVIVGGIYALILPKNEYTIVIPANVGIDNICGKPLHTHDASGTIHVETDVNQNYTIGDFFLIWGKVFNSSGIFQSNQPLPSYLSRCPTGTLVYHSHPTLTIIFKKDFPTEINMTVNGTPVTPNPNPNLQLPRNAATSSAPCTPGPCQAFSIVITYGPGIPASF
jgi:hypothetical protein